MWIPTLTCAEADGAEPSSSAATATVSTIFLIVHRRAWAGQRLFRFAHAWSAVRSLFSSHAVCTSEQTPLIEARKNTRHGRKPRTHQRRDGAPRCVRETAERPTEDGGRAPDSRDGVSRKRTLHDQVRNLRMELSDLQIQSATSVPCSGACHKVVERDR